MISTASYDDTLSTYHKYCRYFMCYERLAYTSLS
jgi:hypothetical protein